VLRVTENECDVWAAGNVESFRFAPIFPAPRTQRVSPGHLIAAASSNASTWVIVWRWYDAVVLGRETAGIIRMWEPAHGEFVARLRSPDTDLRPGSRAYASAGLPGADWWVAGPVIAGAEEPALDITQVREMFTAAGLWTAAFAS
jgi:hypothetical protein